MMGGGVVTGTFLAGFRVKARVGEGAMGTVYLAEDSDGNEVALKVLAPELARDERFRQRFLRESKIAAALEHPHVVRTIASAEENDVLYLAMEYVGGSDLRELLRREGRIEPARALRIVGQVAAALDTAHAAGLVHRDVKPGNILVAAVPGGETAYICDFGLARHVSSVGSLTGDRGFVGTVDYVPPEQIEGAPLDSRADVYSLTCVLFECLAGQRPFDRESELSVVFAHLNEPPPRLSDHRRDLPAAFDGVFATGLAKSPEQRYSTCGELVDAARAALRGKTFVPRKRRRRRLLVAATALLVAAAAAAGVVFANRGHSSPKSPPMSPPQITQKTLAGARVGLQAAAYKRRFGGWRFQTDNVSHYSSLAFQQPQVAVYFPPAWKRALVITTWNKGNRTAAGIGPCSTLAEMKKAYGERVRPTWAGTIKDDRRRRPLQGRRGREARRQPPGLREFSRGQRGRLHQPLARCASSVQVNRVRLAAGASGPGRGPL